MKKVEPSSLEAIRNRARAKADVRELRARHYPMLPSRQIGERNVGCGDLTLTIRLNPPHPAQIGASGRQTGAPRPLRHTLNAQFVTNHVSADAN